MLAVFEQVLGLPDERECVRRNHMSRMLSRIGIVSALTFLSRILGLVRDMLTTAVFGTSALHSAFNFAFTLPSLFRRLLGEGALTAALMPNLADELEREGRPAVHRLVNRVLTWLFLTCFAITIVAFVVFEFLERPDVSERWVLGAKLGKLLFPYVILICMAAIVSAALNLFGKFGVPALTAVWLNCSIILSLGVFGYLWGETPWDKMMYLCYGALLGGALQLVVPAIALLREGWRPRIDFSITPSVKSVMLLTAPGIFGAASHQINVLVTRGLAFNFSDSGATLLYLANRLVELPIGIATIAISTVIFPALSKAIAAKRDSDFESVYRQGVVLSTMMAIPACIGLCLLAGDIIEVLFERGAFSATDTESLVPTLIIFAIGMPFYSFVAIETRAFFSLKDTKTPVKSSVLALAINLILSLSLLAWMQRIEALAIASNSAVVIQSIYLHRRLRAKGYHVSLASSLGAFLKIAVASVAMGLLVLGGRWGIGALSSPWEAILSLATLIPVGVGAYFFVLKWQRLEQVDEIFNVLRRRKSSS